MPITRTPIIDDSGSGRDGTVIDNAWKQEFYNQIDALAAGAAPSYGSFVVTDASGAGLDLSFGARIGYYGKTGRVVYVGLQVIWPATANAAAARLGGLPFVVSDGHAGFAQGYGAPGCRGWAAGGSTILDLYNVSTGVILTNANMSGANITLHGSYLTTP
jgi:hypothetical protein